MEETSYQCQLMNQETGSNLLEDMNITRASTGQQLVLPIPINILQSERSNTLIADTPEYLLTIDVQACDGQIRAKEKQWLAAVPHFTHKEALATIERLAVEDIDVVVHIVGLNCSPRSNEQKVSSRLFVQASCTGDSVPSGEEKSAHMFRDDAVDALAPAVKAVTSPLIRKNVQDWPSLPAV